jgi:hypothetical protein
MSQKGRRGRGSLHHESPDAAFERDNRSTPSDRDVLDALRTVFTWLGARSTPSVYTQYALPPDAKSVDAFKRRHRELRRVGVVGAYTRGKVLACTPEAWATELRRAPRLTVVTDPVTDVGDEIDRALGIRMRISK